ncbi:CoA ester lyase [Acidimicrobiaceae bacterium USS-CC1]|uniref:CoA ester lyase n=1 Tax=Acidiferrimicrobium australe TaxID=2664430 RepID=A0ABW9QY09_9ACTN|nr:CoA ester lyase [Acidiferrimicrobium australe]
MSARSRTLPRRSCHAVPGSSERFLEKAPGLGADEVFLDLEDAVAPAEKVAARSRVAAAVRSADWGDAVVCVRVNAWDSPWTVGDLLEAVAPAGQRLDTVMLPKVERAAEVVALDLVLTQLERTVGLPVGHLGIEAQIETARGLIEAEAIAAASPRVEALILGPVDMSASMGMPSLAGGLDIPAYPGDYFHYVLVKILMAGRAAGVQVVDGPYVKVRDLDGLRAYATRAQTLGYDGKWSLHPDQVPVLNEVFSPSPAQFERACTILDAYARATEGDGRGAVMLGDEMIDEASRKVALALVARGERAGLRRGGG